MFHRYKWRDHKLSEESLLPQLSGAPAMLPRIDGHRKSSVVVGGAITAPAPGSRVGTASGPPPTRDQIVKTVSQRLVEESRVKSESHHRELASVAEELSQHPRLVAEARSLRQQARRQKKLEATRRCKPSNPLLAHPQPAFVDAGNNDEIFGLPLLPAKRSQWVSAARPDEDDDGPITHLKRALAQNFKRVVTLFKKWDVNCDGQVRTSPHTCPYLPTSPKLSPSSRHLLTRGVHCVVQVSTSELYDAIGALNLGNGVGQPEWSREACRALFTALDTNQSGAIDFGELHRALRKFDPCVLPAPDGFPWLPASCRSRSDSTFASCLPLPTSNPNPTHHAPLRPAAPPSRR